MRSTSRLFAGLLSAKVFDFIFYLLLARTLGTEQFGHYTYALSFAHLFSLLTDLGIKDIFTREVSRTPERTRELLGHAFALKVALAALTLVVVIGSSWLSGAPARTLLTVALFTVAMLLNSAAVIFDGLLKAADRAGRAGLALVAQSTMVLLAGMILLMTWGGVVMGAAAYLLGTAVHLAMSAAGTLDLWCTPPADAGDGLHAKAVWRMRLAILRESAPLAAAWVFIALYFRIDAVMLHAMQGATAVGYYGVVYRVFEAFALLAVASRTVLFPFMARAADEPGDTLRVLCRKSLRMHLLFTIGVAVFFTFHARAIVTLIFGATYAPAAPALAILIWALPCSYMADTLFYLLTAQGRQMLGTWAVAATALFNIGLNFVLIPRFSFVGAAVVTAASELLCFSLLFAIFQRSVPAVGLPSVAWRPLLAGGALAAGSALALPWMPAGLVGLIIVGLMTVLAYLLLLILCGAVNRDDAVLLRYILPGSLRRRLVREG